MRILLQANTWTYGLFTGLWRSLRSRGHDVFCDFALPKHEDFFRRQTGAEGEKWIAGTCRAWVTQNLRSPAPGEIERLEQRLGLRLPEVWLADVFHVKFGVLPRRPAVLQRDFFERCFVACAEYYDRIFDATKPDVVLFEGPNGFTDKVLFAVATTNRIPALNLSGGLTEGKITLSHGPHFRNLLFEQLFLGGCTPARESVIAAREYIRSLRTLAVKEAYYNRYVGRGASWSFSSGIRLIKKLTHGAIEAVRPLTPEEQQRRHLMWMTDTSSRPLHAIHRRRNERYVFRNFRDSIPEDAFAAFFLHFQPEATTTAQAPYFINQTSLCEAIAISLPNDVLLSVKEHKASIGDRGHAYFKDLSIFPNVRLISPFVSGVEMAQKARFVATLTGTVGFEAIALNKPVLIFGDTFYDVCPWVHKVKNLEDLATIVPRLCSVEAGNSAANAEAEIERFFACYFASLRDGDCAVFSEYEGVACEQARLNRMAASLEDLLASWLDLLFKKGGDSDGNLKLAKHLVLY